MNGRWLASLMGTAALVTGMFTSSHAAHPSGGVTRSAAAQTPTYLCGDDGNCAQALHEHCNTTCAAYVTNADQSWGLVNNGSWYFHGVWYSVSEVQLSGNGNCLTYSGSDSEFYLQACNTGDRSQWFYLPNGIDRFINAQASINAGQFSYMTEQAAQPGSVVLAETGGTDNRSIWTTGSGEMPAPSGFTTKIFEDQFTGTTLNTSNWVTYLGNQGSRWDDNGYLQAPYSGPNMPGDGFHEEMYGPSQVSVNNGATLTAQKNTNQYNSTYPWISGIITTEGKFALPTNSAWYVQVKAKMPDVTQGMWPAIWFLCGPACSGEHEYDAYEGGFLGSNENRLMATTLHLDTSQVGAVYDTGVDLSAGYHVYGVQFEPGKSITVFLDGRQVNQILAASSVPINALPYDIMLQLQVTAPGASGWHTVTNTSTPASTMAIAEVQAYAP